VPEPKLLAINIELLIGVIRALPATYDAAVLDASDRSRQKHHRAGSLRGASFIVGVLSRIVLVFTVGFEDAPLGMSSSHSTSVGMGPARRMKRS
jgi:hypothetical protein